MAFQLSEQEEIFLMLKIETHTELSRGAMSGTTNAKTELQWFSEECG
jgi:hypothetical protein